MKGYERGRRCRDCGVPVTDYATRCRPCVGIYDRGRPRRHKKHWSDERIIEALRDFASDHGGRPPTKRECAESSCLPHQKTISRRFGSYANAVGAAGLNDNQADINRDEEILASLKRTGGISTRDWDASGGTPTAATVARRFGGWEEALKRAGVELRRRATTWTRDEMICKVKEWSVENGRPPRYRDTFLDNTLPHGSSVLKHFNKWNDLIEAAGLEPFVRTEPTEGEALESLRDYYKRTGEAPSVTIWQRQGYRPSVGYMQQHFGSWLGALSAAGISGRRQGETEEVVGSWKEVWGRNRNMVTGGRRSGAKKEIIYTRG